MTYLYALAVIGIRDRSAKVTVEPTLYCSAVFSRIFSTPKYSNILNYPFTTFFM